MQQETRVVNDLVLELDLVTELQKLIPGLSKWRIDLAHNAIEAGRGQLVHENPIF